MPDDIAQFAGAKYLSLETFRKTGMGVRTPVWFVQDELHNASMITVFYIYSEADAGKVKRIRNNRAGTFAAPGSTGAPASVKMTRLPMVNSCSRRSTAC